MKNYISCVKKSQQRQIKMSNYESNTKELIRRMKAAERELLEEVGVFLKSEAEQRARQNFKEDTGEMFQKFEYEINKSSMGVKVGNKAYYSLFLEKGTFRIRANPFIEPSVTENIGRIGQLAKDKLQIKE